MAIELRCPRCVGIRMRLEECSSLGERLPLPPSLRCQRCGTRWQIRVMETLAGSQRVIIEKPLDEQVTVSW
jgi:hypothetical protein